jgi:RHS repeat-associated protein
MNGQEKDDEIAQGIYTAMYWEYDSRIGRRWNLDPKPFVGISYYSCFLNNPIMFADPNGDKVRFDNAKAFFKVIGKAITDKTFRQQLIAQHKATRVTTQSVTDKNTGDIHTEDVEHDQYFHYRYNKQSENSLQGAANELDNENTTRDLTGVHSSKNHLEVAFSDNSEEVTLRATGHPLEKGGSKSKKSDQMYSKGTITINLAATYDANNSVVSFYHGATLITNSTFNVDVGGSGLINGTQIPFDFSNHAKIRMVVTSNDPNNKTGNPGALTVKVNITRK